MSGDDPLTPAVGDITRMLLSIGGGDREALNRLVSTVYAELRALAHRHLVHGRPGEVLQTTALVHEAYLKLAATSRPEWQDRRHFFAVASRAMRQIIVDQARSHAAQKRGGDFLHLSIDERQIAAADRATELVRLDQALDELETLNPRAARMVEMRFFAGLSVEETAAALDLSERTVKREWRKARAFLFAAVGGDDPA